MLTKFVQSIAPNVSTLQGNTILNDECISFGIVAGTSIVSDIEAIDWSDSIIERCRFHSTTFTNSTFDRVAIIDSDLSGVSFNNCLLRECLIMGVKSRFQLAFDNCILDRVMLAKSRADTIEIHNSRIVAIDFLSLEASEVNFHECQVHKRNGRVSFEECDIAKMRGVETLGKQGISVHVDAPMWQDLGDHFLKERGFQPLEGSAVADNELLEEIGHGLSQRRKAE